MDSELPEEGEDPISPWPSSNTRPRARSTGLMTVSSHQLIKEAIFLNSSHKIPHQRFKNSNSPPRSSCSQYTFSRQSAKSLTMPVTTRAAVLPRSTK